jgi:hypothetical protein
VPTLIAKSPGVFRVKPAGSKYFQMIKIHQNREDCKPKLELLEKKKKGLTIVFVPEL